MAADGRKSGALWETVKTIFWALVIAGIFRTLFFQPFWIPSGSMKDTLLIGDFLFVNKMAYGYSYASCPSIRLGGLDIDAKDICGWLDGDNTRILGSEPERGDLIVIYSDAAVETRAPDGKQLGEDGFQARVSSISPDAPQEFGPAVLQRLVEHHGDDSFEDDLTLIVLHHNAADPPRLALKDRIRVLGKMLGLEF